VFAVLSSDVVFMCSTSGLHFCEQTRCSAIAERPHCRVCYSFGQKWKTGTGRQYFTDFIGLCSTTVTYSIYSRISRKINDKIMPQKLGGDL